MRPPDDLPSAREVVSWISVWGSRTPELLERQRITKRGTDRKNTLVAQDSGSTRLVGVEAVGPGRSGRDRALVGGSLVHRTALVEWTDPVDVTTSGVAVGTVLARNLGLTESAS